MRIRLSQKLSQMFRTAGQAASFAIFLSVELGVPISRYVTEQSNAPRDLFLKGELRDVLDAITLFYRSLLELRREEDEVFSGRPAYQHEWNYQTQDPKDWLEFVTRVFREENLGYRLDKQGVVHYFIDLEFARTKESAIAALDSPLLKAPRDLVVDAFARMDGTPPETKLAVRSMFDAVETLVKQIVPDSSRLTKNLARDELSKVCLASFSGDSTERKVREEMFEALGYWADAIHGYRHAQADVELPRPSEQLAVYVLGTGSGRCRWLAPYAIAAMSSKT